MLQLEVVVTVSKEGSAWGTLAQGSVCSLRLLGNPGCKQCFVHKPLKEHEFSPGTGATGSPPGSTSSPRPGKEAGAWSRGSFIPQVPATRWCACAPRAANKHPELLTLAHAQSPISPQATALHLARGMGLGRVCGGAEGRGRVCVSWMLRIGRRNGW